MTWLSPSQLNMLMQMQNYISNFDLIHGKGRILIYYITAAITFTFCWYFRIMYFTYYEHPKLSDTHSICHQWPTEAQRFSRLGVFVNRKSFLFMTLTSDLPLFNYEHSNAM
jgi:hypothetical protein